MALSAIPGWGVKLQGEQQVEDEFTCPGVLRGSLLDLKNTVERVFRVILNIGGEDEAYTTQDGQIWLQLKGRKGEVEAAKLFVKGIVNQETQKEVQYPDTLHCVFCGAKGLFVDCLVRITSAHIVMGSMGSLLISGLVEPVVKACSLIMDLVDKYQNRQVPFTEIAGESLDSRRAFKSLVEGLEDSHTLDLLVLPVMVKEVLLDLVKQSGVDPSTLDSASAGSKTLLELHEKMDRLMHRQSTDSRTPDILGNSNFPLKQNGTYNPYTPPSDFSSKSHSYVIKDNEDQPGEEPSLNRASRDDFFRYYVAEETPRVRAEGIEGKTQVRHVQRLFEGVPQETEEQQESEQQEENLMSAGSKQEHEHLLKFFTAMGYDEQVVCRVLTRTGPKEASQLLDLIQQEQDKSGIQLEHSNARVSDHEALPGATSEASVGVNGAPSTTEDDFVLGVVKKAAASCGYTEEKVIEVYSNLPELTPHELIVELQKRKDLENDMRKRAEEMEEQQRKATALQKARERDAREERRVDRKREATKVEKPESDRVTSIREISNKKEGVQVGGRETISIEPSIREPFMLTNALDWARKPEHPSAFQNQPRQIIPPAVRGPPQPTYPSPLYPNFPEQQINAPMGQPATRPKHTQGPPSNKSGAVVTGPQRFLEGLEKPFDLQLRNDPGDSGLRQIIIDGSNVAMSHGLGTFFSCRGIALAVQYFWNRGHRKISVFVPQWRQKKDAKIKEQHFMTQLQDLGLLSFTPSREVMGQRINSYDDRIMLQCAQQTNGVIVTNDNMRDLVDESVAWKEIIKKRLLQYLFAGDMFMVPDDPLGRSGPHLNDFLRNQNSLPAPGSHSFAGVPSSFSLPAPQPRANTEVLQYRERTPGGRPQKSGRGPPKVERKGNRSAEETLRLKQQLVQIFPGQESVVMMTLQCHPTVTDINDLSSFILEQQEDEQE